MRNLIYLNSEKEIKNVVDAIKENRDNAVLLFTTDYSKDAELEKNPPARISKNVHKILREKLADRITCSVYSFDTMYLPLSTILHMEKWSICQMLKYPDYDFTMSNIPIAVIFKNGKVDCIMDSFEEEYGDNIKELIKIIKTL